MASTKIRSRQQLEINSDVTFGAAYRITNALDAVSAQDYVTLAQLNAISVGLDVHPSVRAASTVNLVLSGTQTVDGVALVVGDRVLVKNQSTGANNGIYVVAAGAWTRALDADTSPEVTGGMFTFVEEGTGTADTGWLLTTDNPITLGTTALVFTQFSGAGSYTAGSGLTLTGTTFSVNTDGITTGIVSGNVIVRSTATADQILKSSGTAGTAAVWGSINLAAAAAVGTSILPVANGGTGATLAATGGAGQVVRQSSVGGAFTVSALTAAEIGSGAALTKVDDTNVTLTLGGTPASALLAATSLTLGWTGTLSVARGGTGAGTFTQYGVIFGNATAALGVTAVGATGQYLKSGNGTAAPAFAQVASTEINNTTFVATVSVSSLSPLFTTATAGTATAPTFTFSLNTQTANTVFAGPSSGSAAAPTFRALSALDIPDASTKKGVKAATTANLTVTGSGTATLSVTAATTLTLDGVVLANGDRVLVKDQTATQDNGIFVVGGIGTAVTLTRTADANTSALLADAEVSIDQGTAQAGRQYYTRYSSTGTLGTTAVIWIEEADVSSVQTFTNKAGYNGLIITSNTGVITSGTWNASVVGAIYGGTGQSTYTTGDILWASATNTLSKLGVGTQGNVLQVGAAGAISWGAVSLSGGAAFVTGTLPRGNGGTGTAAVTTDGQLLIGNTATGNWSVSTLTAGTNITITNGNGTITINSAGALSASNFVFHETPAGTVNGVTTAFTLANTPTAGTVQVFVNGQLQTLTTDYTIATNTITFVAGSIPQTGDIVRSHYMK